MKKFLLGNWQFICLFLVIFLFFAKLFFPPSIFITPDYGRSDAWHLSIANKYYYAQELKKNRIPIWNPHIGTGFPTLAEGQTGIFFIPNLIFFKFLPFVFAYNFSIIFTFISAAWGTYLFCRSLGLNKPAAVYGGLIFALGGFLLVHIPHLHLIQTASMLPWLFWATSEFFQKKQLLYLILLSIILSQQIFAGFPQLTFYSLVALSFFIIFKILSEKSKIKLFSILSSFIILGFLIGAVQLIPTYELLSLSSRNSNPRLILEQFPYKFENLLQFLDPFILGSPKDGSYPRWIPQQWGIFWESVAYVGLLPLAFAIAVPFVSFLKKTKSDTTVFIRRKTVFIFSTIGVFSLLLALGPLSPTHPIFSFVPFSLFRVPSRFLLITQFSLSILSVLYLEKLARKPVFYIIIFFLSAGNLFFVFYNFNPTEEAQKYFSDPPTAAWLKKNRSQRILSIGQSNIWNDHFLSSGWKNTGFYEFSRNSLDQNSNLIFDISNIKAYESLLPTRFTLTNSIIDGGIKIQNNQVQIQDITTKYLTSQNVSHITSTYEIENENYQKVFETEKFENISFKIYEILENPQRIFITDKVRVASTIPQIGQIMLSENFNPANEIVTEEDLPEKKLKIESWNVKILEEKPTSLTLETISDGDGLLVVSDSFYPGWKAEIDKTKAKIFAANIKNRSIYLPQGKHIITFKFEPGSFRYGLAISLVSIFVLFTIALKYKNREILK